MGWLSSERWQEYENIAKELIRLHGESLTWEQALPAVAADTIEIARWSGLKKSGLSPCDALKRLKRFD
jgi:hypothetical protein